MSSRMNAQMIMNLGLRQYEDETNASEFTNESEFHNIIRTFGFGRRNQRKLTKDKLISIIINHDKNTTRKGLLLSYNKNRIDSRFLELFELCYLETNFEDLHCFKDPPSGMVCEMDGEAQQICEQLLEIIKYYLQDFMISSQETIPSTVILTK